MMVVVSQGLYYCYDKLLQEQSLGFLWDPTRELSAGEKRV